jgi:hypothetical protein
MMSVFVILPADLYVLTHRTAHRLWLTLMCVCVCVCVLQEYSSFLIPKVRTTLCQQYTLVRCTNVSVGIAVLIFAEKRAESIFSGTVTLVSRCNVLRMRTWAGYLWKKVSVDGSGWTEFWIFKEYFTSLACMVEILLWLLKNWRYFCDKSYQTKG